MTSIVFLSSPSGRINVSGVVVVVVVVVVKNRYCTHMHDGSAFFLSFYFLSSSGADTHHPKRKQASKQRTNLFLLRKHLLIPFQMQGSNQIIRYQKHAVSLDMLGQKLASFVVIKFATDVNGVAAIVQVDRYYVVVGCLER